MNIGIYDKYTYILRELFMVDCSVHTYILTHTCHHLISISPSTIISFLSACPLGWQVLYYSRLAEGSSSACDLTP